MLLHYKTNCLDVSSTGSFPFPMSMHTHIIIPYHPYGNGDSLNLDLNGIEGVIIHPVFPKTMVSTLLSVNTFIGWPSFMGARRAHKRLFLAAICSSDSLGLLTRIRSLSLLHALLRLYFLCFEVVWRLINKNVIYKLFVITYSSGKMYNIQTIHCTFIIRHISFTKNWNITSML